MMTQEDQHQSATALRPRRGLRLAGQIELKPCPTCAGIGSIPCPMTVAVRTLGFNAVPALQPSTGHPIPCPHCQGKKSIPNA